MGKSRKLRVGDHIRVLSKAEILTTLDHNGRLEGLPFMPEMFAYCGHTLRVSKRAHKTCDPSLGMVGRSMKDAVHLEEVRCDGGFHDGCEAGCLIFWKEKWLQRLGDDQSEGCETVAGTCDDPPSGRGAGCTEADVHRGVRVPAGDNSGETVYACQNTHLKTATTPLRWWDVRQYVEDYTSGNVGLWQFIKTGLGFIWYSVAGAGIGLGSAMRWSYDLFQRLIGGTPYPLRHGEVPPGQPTPTARIELREGELVRVKPYREILKTLDENMRNRGMYFDPELVPFTGRTYRVKRRVHQIVDEKTSKMVRFKTDAIILEGVSCQARYAKCRRFCPRAIYPYWREIWLERVGEPSSAHEAVKR